MAPGKERKWRPSMTSKSKVVVLEKRFDNPSLNVPRYSCLVFSDTRISTNTIPPKQNTAVEIFPKCLCVINILSPFLAKKSGPGRKSKGKVDEKEDKEDRKISGRKSIETSKEDAKSNKEKGEQTKTGVKETKQQRGKRRGRPPKRKTGLYLIFEDQFDLMLQRENLQITSNKFSVLG